MEVNQPSIAMPTVPGETDRMGPSDIDIDMDLDLGPIDDPEDMQLSLDLPSTSQPLTPATLGTPNDTEFTPEKLHIRGLDELSTQDIKAYCSEYSKLKTMRIEWIDDTSANIVYEDAESASRAFHDLVGTTHEALQSFPISKLHPAKPIASRANATLFVRTALRTDRKRAKAHETSRYYLLHPEQDPHEMRRQGIRNHSRGFRRRLYSDEENQRRRRSDRLNGFDASMYDDHTPSESLAGRSSPTSRRGRRGDHYRPSRDRSASPTAESSRRSTNNRRRSPAPRHQAQSTRPDDVKELLPHKVKNDLGDSGLESSKILNSKSPRELFPNKTSLSNHRRTDAVDAADEAADLFAGKFCVPFVDGSLEVKSLAERITAAPTAGNRDPDPGGDLSASSPREGHRSSRRRSAASENGLTIKGASRQDLFPEKTNVGRELFADKLHGRGRTRMRAEDLFG